MKRLEYVDIMKGLGIILVILGHINAYNSLYKPYVYAFHMVIFFFVYGYVTSFEQKDIKNTLSKRFKSLVIPYLLWAFIYAGLSINTIIYILYASHYSIASVSNSSLWYLPTFFISVILFELIINLFAKKKIKKDKFVLVLSLISLVYLFVYFIMGDYSIHFGAPWGIDASLTGVVLISVGFICRFIFDKFKLLDKKFSIHLVIILMFFLLTFTYKLNNIDYVLLAENTLGNSFLFIFTGLCGTLLVLFISYLISKIKFDLLNKGLLFVGKNTLFIMASQKIFINPISSVIEKLQLNCVISVFIILMATLVLTSLGSFICCKFVPQLNGK